MYKSRDMATSTKTADEIMFATGNANKLREVSYLICMLMFSNTLVELFTGNMKEIWQLKACV